MTNTAEIHFHQPEQVSVYADSSPHNDDDRTGEILLISLFSLRMLSNLGTNDVSCAIAEWFLALTSQTIVLAPSINSSGFELIPYPGNKGRYSFASSIESQGATSPHFRFKAHGFGFFAKNMDRHAPVGVEAIVKHYAIKRSQDYAFLMGLQTALRACGYAYLNSGIGLVNQLRIGMSAAEQGTKMMNGIDS
ncbi:hypothetical protein [Stieleria varia]|uniref:Uncharacterized protein n=1 Tax=Stieleria varia TaxID=2528005 RepID=A0A5C6AH86_9BACT|nr:hypothetical protein [Stieleria varia]TWT98545.1 hypothetical protein Pla52n_50610 [Stieleria varia]